ncbi:hypothetical protein McanMca71_006796 [Microsporum canis]|uniref:Uncharacterized protein n=1 Tax=Arthroderma otae (strain ATCC MYA-4605 / CBS 113480) TaxID=554155 RepID=C5FMY6_ARTOC|nr:uncharacterized protein MCYG_04041 [Microsporum canis CBS 113480]EEQ31222.1 predicted protein [Microsporum canis CBS 113480]
MCHDMINTKDRQMTTVLDTLVRAFWPPFKPEPWNIRECRALPLYISTGVEPSQDGFTLPPGAGSVTAATRQNQACMMTISTLGTSETLPATIRYMLPTPYIFPGIVINTLVPGADLASPHLTAGIFIIIRWR